MLYAVDGVALGGWQLVDLALMALVAIELLSLIFLKVVIILLGALLYATGPITIGLVATESGAAIARAWASAVAMLIALPVVWATLFAVGALLIGDAGTAGPLIAGNSSVGSLLGGVLLALAGAASLWLCLRAAREAMGLLRMQLGGLLALSHRGSSAASAVSRHRSRARRARCGGSARGSRRRPVAPAASSRPLARAAPRSCAAAARSATSAGTGCSAPPPPAAARRRGSAAPHAAALVGRSRAGAVAVRMAKAGTAGWYASQNGKTAAPGRTGEQHRPRPAGGAAPADGSDARAAAIGRRAAVGALGSAAARAAALTPDLAAGASSGRSGPAPSATRPGASTPRSPSSDASGDRRASRAAGPQVHAAAAADRQPSRTGEAMTPTLRRLNDRERYYGLTWPGWVALAVAGAILYGAVRVSPFGLRATVTVVVLVLAFVASVALALQGQTIGPGRYLLALYRYRRHRQAARATDRARTGTASCSTPRQPAERRARASARGSRRA